MIKSDPKHPQIQCQHLPRAPEPARTPGLASRHDRMGAKHAPEVLGLIISIVGMPSRLRARSVCVPGLLRLEPSSHLTTAPTFALLESRKPPIWVLVSASTLCAEHTYAQPAPCAARSDGPLGSGLTRTSRASARAHSAPLLKLMRARELRIGLTRY